eukprot:TRINITY_DN812_c0_g1_i1.p1 TRINITY_DN812_c0_g1~~TRINITY_DN812_c0_g1_i1.p1  ORF type:complete len:227 (+),score=40.06 TRINITY_DN812_c0_g1_i1:11-691(+)
MNKLILITLLTLTLCIFAEVPGQVLDLTPFSLQMSTGTPGHPTMIYQPQLNTFQQQPYFYVNGTGVVFLAYVNGTHTSGSEYPRTELAESATWSNANGQGTHTLTVKEAYIHLPKNRPEVVGAQILSSSGAICQVRLNDNNIVVYGPSGNPTIVPNYVLGTVFTLEIVAANGQIQIYYNGNLKIAYNKSGSGWYFKSGAYVQSNLTYDSPSQYGQVDIYAVQIQHS